jgi:hypothetical protein
MVWLSARIHRHAKLVAWFACLRRRRAVAVTECKSGRAATRLVLTLFDAVQERIRLLAEVLDPGAL